MRKSKKWLLTTWFVFPVLVYLSFLILPTKADARACSDYNFQVSGEPPSVIQCTNRPTQFNITVRSDIPFANGDRFYILQANTYNAVIRQDEVASQIGNGTNTIQFTITSPLAFESGENFHQIHSAGGEIGNTGAGCLLYSYTITDNDWSANVYITQERNSERCYGYPSGCLERGQATLQIRNIRECSDPYANKTVHLFVEAPDGSNLINSYVLRTDSGGNLPDQILNLDQLGTYELFLEANIWFNANNILDSHFTVNETGTCATCQTTTPTTSTGQPQEYKICEQISETLRTSTGENAKERCIQCVGGDELGREGIWTAVGCISRDPDQIVRALLRIGLGLGGGFSLLIILTSGFVLSVSQGEPERINQAKQWLTSALVGLLFIIFSVTLLRFIGYTIFQIPGFGG